MKRLLIGLLISCGAANFGAGQATSYDELDQPKSIEIEQRLDQEQDMMFNDATLVDVRAFLETNGIPTYLDVDSLDDVGLSIDFPLTFRHKSIRLRDGLHLLLKQFDLTWGIRHGCVIITTPEEAESELITKIYDVRNLIELVPVSRWDGGIYGQTSIVYQYDFDSLLNAIRSSVATASWDFVGGPGSIQPYYTRRMRVMIVSQTYDIHRQIDSFLRKLAAHGGETPLPAVPEYFRPQPTRRSQGLPIVYPAAPTQHIRSSQLRTTGQ